MSVNSNEEFRNNEVSPHNNTNDSIPLFLLKTYEILQNPNYSEIISWTKNGEGFVVKKVKDFAEKILPAHFRHNNYTSFVRQLNMYDFHKTRQQNQQNAFKNSMFKRGSRHLLKQIQRKDYKKNKEPRPALSINKMEQNPLSEKKNSKQTQEMTQNFYRKWTEKLTIPEKKMQQKISQLASIQQIQPENKIQLLNLLQFLMQTKKVNKQSMLIVDEFSRNCEHYIGLKQSKLAVISTKVATKGIEGPQQGKFEQHQTIVSFNSFVN